MKLSQLGEFGLIERIRRSAVTNRGVRLGIGDDAAWVEHPTGSSLITADLLIEGVHFDLKWTSLVDLGYKALAVNLSDIAAMGGVPSYVILSLGIARNFDSKHIDQLYRGIHQLAKKYRVALVGGDTNLAGALIISVCVIGHPVNEPIQRRGAHVGDDIYVTGTLGDSALGLALLRQESAPRRNLRFGQLLKRHHRPTPRLAAGALLAKEKLATAMIDISDGLLQDLGHICRASKVGAVICNDQLPLSKEYRALSGPAGTDYALSGGEDYELLFCAAPRHRRRLASLQQARVAITRIGTCVPAARGIRVLDGAGKNIDLHGKGHDHFKKQ